MDLKLFWNKANPTSFAQMIKLKSFTFIFYGMPQDEPELVMVERDRLVRAEIDTYTNVDGTRTQQIVEKKGQESIPFGQVQLALVEPYIDTGQTGYILDGVYEHALTRAIDLNLPFFCISPCWELTESKNILSVAISFYRIYLSAHTSLI